MAGIGLATGGGIGFCGPIEPVEGMDFCILLLNRGTKGVRFLVPVLILKGVRN